MLKGILTREAGAVLNKTNKTALRQAFDTIRKVLTGAGIDLDAEEDDADPKEAGGFSIGDLATLLQGALDATREAPEDPNAYREPMRIVDIFDDRFVYCEGWSNSTFYSVDYSVTDQGVVTLGAPTFVVRKVDYLTPGASAQESASDPGVVDLPLIAGAPIKLVESAIAADGTARIKLINADQWGSTGFYSADVLRRDGPIAFPRGTKMYIDHDTPAEEAQRPEGTITRLAATFEEDATFATDPKHGAGLYARIRVRDIFRQDLDDIADAIGTSIRAGGKAKIGEAQGKRGPIITALLPSKLNRVDFVTIPGAGGKILPLFESLRSREAIAADITTDDHEGDQSMTDEQIREAISAGITAGLQAAIAPISAEVARLREAAALRDAASIVADHLGTIAGLPRATRDRLVPLVAREAVIDQATGALDRAKLIESANAAAQSEAAYIASIGGARIVGLGESGAPPADDGTPEKTEAELTTIFAGWGLSESGAKIAARGRVR
jgi:hypothetical protein